MILVNVDANSHATSELLNLPIMDEQSIYVILFTNRLAASSLAERVRLQRSYFFKDFC
jgi:hypothetical protein